MPCPDEGVLRAFLDNEISPEDRAMLTLHLIDCADCQISAAEQRAFDGRIGQLLGTGVVPDPEAAFARFQSRQRTQFSWRNVMSSLPLALSGARRPALVGLASVTVGACLFCLPAVRGAAGEFLQSFRVQSVVFMPVHTDRLQELSELNIDPRTLFVGEPHRVGHSGPAQTVSTLAAASQLTNFTVQRPTLFPHAVTSTHIKVMDRQSVQCQVDVENLRHALTLLNVDDVTLPKALGSTPITAQLPPSAQTDYVGKGYQLRLYQGVSPTIKLPEGVDLSQVGRAGLRVLGMSADKADELSRKINWSSTLLVPFPSDLDSVRQVQVGGNPGLLVGSTGYKHHRLNGWTLYWQRGERFFVLHGSGKSLDDGSMIAAADSVK